MEELKAKSANIVDTSKIVVISSKPNDLNLPEELSREERKKEASKPLYLIRYE